MELSEEFIEVFKQIGQEVAGLIGEDVIVDDCGNIECRWEEYIGCGEYEGKSKTYTTDEIMKLYMEREYG